MGAAGPSPKLRSWACATPSQPVGVWPTTLPRACQQQPGSKESVGGGEGASTEKGVLWCEVMEEKREEGQRPGDLGEQEGGRGRLGPGMAHAAERRLGSRGPRRQQVEFIRRGGYTGEWIGEG